MYQLFDACYDFFDEAPVKAIGISIGIVITGVSVVKFARSRSLCTRISNCVCRNCRSMRDRIVSCVCHRPRLNIKRRELFNTRFRMNNTKVHEGHSHGQSAAIRTGASFSIDRYITTTGGRVFTVSYSSRDDGVGQRLYYHNRDFVLEAKDDIVQKYDLIKMIDVDYYADMEYWLSFGKPILIYTFVPETAGGAVADSNFYISNNKIVMTVNGGGRYEHELWDYDHDYITVDTIGGIWIVGIDQKYVSKETCRRVIQLTPLTWVPFPASLLVARSPLRRRVLSNSIWNQVIHQCEDGNRTISIAKSSSTYSITLPISVYDAIRIRHEDSKTHRNIADIERILRKEELDCPHISAAILYDFLQSGLTIDLGTPAILSSGNAPTHYQTMEPLVLEDAKEYARVVGPKILDTAVFPGVSYNNDQATIDGRVKKMANNVIPPNRYLKYVNEFLNLIPCGEGVPWTAAQVLAKQRDGLQAQRGEKARSWLTFPFPFTVKAFQKKESYQKYTDPRNISTVATNHTIQLSKYTYPFSQNVLKMFPWYMPGKTPDEIGERMMELCALLGDQPILETDYTRLDGTISQWLIENVQDAAFLRYFGSDPELLALLRAEHSPNGISAQGIKYEPLFSRKSGSPTTTCGNTLICAVIIFCALRRHGYSIDQAFALMGLIYGDDGVSGGVSAEFLEKVAQDFGLKLKVTVRPVGHWVTFLGRIFEDPWTTMSSFQDPKRTLSKIHTSCTNPREVPADLALLWKAVAYSITDSKTPLIREYCNMVCRVKSPAKNIFEYELKNIPAALFRDLPYFLQTVENCSWYQDEDDTRRYEIIAKMLETNVAYIKDVCAILNKTTDFTDFYRKNYQFFPNLKPKVEIPVVTNDTNMVLEPAETTTVTTQKPKGGKKTKTTL